jgi:hypothetical protein
MIPVAYLQPDLAFASSEKAPPTYLLELSSLPMRFGVLRTVMRASEHR